MAKTHSVTVMPTIKVDAYQCARCGHIWLPREPTKRENRPPVLCAKCKSAYWNIPKPKPKPKEVKRK
jgi:rubredoxin